MSDYDVCRAKVFTSGSPCLSVYVDLATVDYLRAQRSSSQNFYARPQSCPRWFRIFVVLSVFAIFALIWALH